MFLLYCIIFLFIFIVNILLTNLFDRLKIDNNIFETAVYNQYTTVSCLHDHWFVIEKNERLLDVKYLTDEQDNYIPCTINPGNNNYNLKSCGKSGKFNNKSEYCYMVLVQLLSLVNI